MFNSFNICDIIWQYLPYEKLTTIIYNLLHMLYPWKGKLLREILEFPQSGNSQRKA